MSMASLKTKDNGGCSPCASSYGWGTRISLTEEQVEALGLKANPPAAGALVGITAIAIVQCVEQRVSTDGDDDGVDVCLSLQLTDMELTGNAVGPAKSLY